MLQSVPIFKDGTVNEYDAEPGIDPTPENLVLSQTFHYQWDGKTLTIDWGGGAKRFLELVTKTSNIEWDSGLSLQISEIQDGEEFFYETEWKDSGEPSDNAMYLVKSHDSEKTNISNSNNPNPTISKFDSIKIGDIVSYGNYEQDGTDNNGSENIDWIVLDKQSDRMLLISNFALDCKLYDSTHWWDMSWEICTLRNWLNNDFFSESFNSEEKNAILPYTTESGLSDNVFILNKEEADQYLTDELKMCRATKYALNNGAYSAYNGNCFWWLRSSGAENDSVPYMDYNGDYEVDGNAIRNSNYAVRPAIWVSSNANVKVARL